MDRSHHSSDLSCHGHICPLQPPSPPSTPTRRPQHAPMMYTDGQERRGRLTYGTHTPSPHHPSIFRRSQSSVVSAPHTTFHPPPPYHPPPHPTRHTMSSIISQRNCRVSLLTTMVPGEPGCATTTPSLPIPPLLHPDLWQGGGLVWVWCSGWCSEWCSGQGGWCRARWWCGGGGGS